MKKLAVAFVVIAVGGVLCAQSQQPTFKSSTELVEVDVAVTGKDGKPIRGLTAADFAILGQKIVAFTEVSHDVPDDPERAAMLRVPHDVADNQIARTATVALIVLDDAVPRAQRERARDTIRQVVDSLGPGVQIGLMSLSGRLGFEITDDRARLLQAINRLNWSGESIIPQTDRAITGTCNFRLFEQAARMLAPIAARRKAVIAVTPFCGQDVKGAVDSMRGRANSDLEVLAVNMVDTMRRANVAFYAVDPRGEAGYSLAHFGGKVAGGGPAGTNMMTARNPNPTDGLIGRYEERNYAEQRVNFAEAPHAVEMELVTRHFDPVVISQDNLEAVGKATGGFVVTNTADIDGGIKRIVNDFDHYYLLGFNPPQKGGFAQLNVRVSRDDAVLRYRRGFTTDPVKKANESRALMPTISGVMPVPDVPLRLLAMPFVTAAGAKTLMAIELRAPKSELAAPGGSLSDDVSVTVVAVRADQAKVERAFKFTRHVTITPAYAREGGDTVAYQIVRSLDLPPGPYQFRVSVTSAKLARTGSVYLTTDVPDSASRPFDLSGPLLAFADINKHPAAATIVDSGLPSIAPVFDRVFANGDAIRVLCPILKGSGAPTAVRIELIDDVGKIVSTTDAGVQTRGIYGVDAVVNLKSLRSGPYRLRVTASSQDATSTREVGLAIK